ncbi:hypothetical protein PV664_37105 [Streptomyces sp. ME01-18a]|nr:hypothetical protein [Streptomyces sp. ME01-18a]MDX3434412.1 hypothetical protein [Streptomyces sp. ME01-18a]
MERVEEISAFALGRVTLCRVPVNRQSTLARYGQLSKAQTSERAPDPRRTVLLTAVVRQLEAQAVDDPRRGPGARGRRVGRGGDARESGPALQHRVRPSWPCWASRTRWVPPRPGGACGRRCAARRLPALSRRRVKDRPLLSREVDAALGPAMWKRAVLSNTKLPQGAVDRDAYVVCVLEQLHRALNRRDVAAPSNRWADPRARLMDGARWEAMWADVLAGLSPNEDASEHLAQLTRGLDAAWRQMADRLEEAGDDAKVEVVVPEGGGRARLSVNKLGAVGEPESLTWLKTTTEATLPRIDLPDLLFEIHPWTGFLDSFGQVSDGAPDLGRNTGMKRPVRQRVADDHSCTIFHALQGPGLVSSMPSTRQTFIRYEYIFTMSCVNSL